MLTLLPRLSIAFGPYLPVTMAKHGNVITYTTYLLVSIAT